MNSDDRKKIQDKLVYVSFDIETSNVSRKHGEIISIAIQILNSKFEDRTQIKSWVFNVRGRIDPMASSIHGFYKEDLKDFPYFEEKVSEINNFISENIKDDENGVFVAHNGYSFDFRFIYYSYKRANACLPLNINYFYDTLYAIKQDQDCLLSPKNENKEYDGAYGLKDLVPWLTEGKDDMKDHHEAEADVRGMNVILKSKYLRDRITYTLTGLQYFIDTVKKE